MIFQHYAVTDEKFNEKLSMRKKKSSQQKGIEGIIFYFGDKYSKPLNCVIDTKDGKKVTVKMGS